MRVTAEPSSQHASTGRRTTAQPHTPSVTAVARTQRRKLELPDLRFLVPYCVLLPWCVFCCPISAVCRDKYLFYSFVEGTAAALTATATARHVCTPRNTRRTSKSGAMTSKRCKTPVARPIVRGVGGWRLAGQAVRERRRPPQPAAPRGGGGCRTRKARL